MYKVDKGIELKPSRVVYPWDSLEVGHSFLIPKTAKAGFLYGRQLVYARNKKNKDSGLLIVYKAQLFDDGLRVFRIA